VSDYLASYVLDAIHDVGKVDDLRVPLVAAPCIIDTPDSEQYHDDKDDSKAGSGWRSGSLEYQGTERPKKCGHRPHEARAVRTVKRGRGGQA
jgi:hypothetical protein